MLSFHVLQNAKSVAFRVQRQCPPTEPLNYISVESVEEYSKKVEALGGKILVQKMEISGIGWWALALDPEGNSFGILEYMKK